MWGDCLAGALDLIPALRAPLLRPEKGKVNSVGLSMP